MRAIGIIPARYAATRLPGKALKLIGAKPLIQHVYESARRARSLDDVIVATDDVRIRHAVAAFGGTAVMTSPRHISGTDRLAEAARALSCEVVVNIQGDEPLLSSEVIDTLVATCAADATLPAATVATPLRREDELHDPGVVKVVVDTRGNALYFSRAPIPFIRGERPEDLRYLKHLGLYAYRKAFLLDFTRRSPTPLERAEKLEQLRIIEHGQPLRVVITSHDSVGVDTPDDLARVRAVIAERDAEQHRLTAQPQEE